MKTILDFQLLKPNGKAMEKLPGATMGLVDSRSSFFNKDQTTVFGDYGATAAKSNNHNNISSATAAIP